MVIPFTKMHGLGNDYLYVNCFETPLGAIDRPALALAMSDRHRGVGSDGLILITPTSAGAKADVRMEMYNADGSRGEMCGNGIRCVAKYAVEHGLVSSRAGAGPTLSVQNREPKIQDESAGEVAIPLRVETDRGVLALTAYGEKGRVRLVRVSMGRPILQPRDVPVVCEGSRCVRASIEVDGRRLTMTCVSMGNPHAVFFVDDLNTIDIAAIGPRIERHSRFPARINAHFAQALSRGEVRMRTWERGSGITQACGTGACAVVVAGVLEGRLDRRALVHLPGGDLRIAWPADDAEVEKTGPAQEVFSGEWVTDPAGTPPSRPPRAP